MSLKVGFQLMADYNHWMNKSIYEAASQLNPSELAENRGAFFGSVIGTLNYILVGDIIWLKRFASYSDGFMSLDQVLSLQIPEALDVILYDDFNHLYNARVALDKTIIEFADELSDDRLASSLSYVNTKGESFSRNFGHLVQHFFNHQTHHRGQVSTLLSQRGIDIGVTDLLVSIPDMS